MKIFETVLKQLESIGFSENQNPFNRRQILLGLQTILGASLICVYLLRIANTFDDYMNCAFFIIKTILVIISQVSTVFKTATIFVFINQFNVVIGQSE